MSALGVNWLELSSAGAAFTIITGCTILGAQIGLGSRVDVKRSRIAGADTIVGLGLAGGLFSVFAGALGMRPSVFLVLLGLGISAGTIRLIRHRTVPGGLGFWVAAALLTPVLQIAGEAPATMWDDFFHWLPNAAYAYRFDSLARPGLPEPFSRWPAYPQMMPFLTLAASKLAGRFIESAGAVSNLLILGSFSGALIDILKEIRRDAAEFSGLSHAGLVAVALMLVTLLNPSFNHHVVMSSYADAATGVAVALCGLLGCLILQRLSQRRFDDLQMLAWRFAFVAAALVNLKQANPALLALLVAGFALLVLRCPAIRFSSFAGLLPVMLAPAAVIWLSWRIYIAQNLTGGEMAFRTFSEWNWAEAPDMFSSIWEIYCLNPVFYAGMTTIAIAGLAVIRNPMTPFHWLLVLNTICWVGYNGFLLLVYLGAMNSEETAMGADYWRYMPHLGLLATSAIMVGIASAPSPDWAWPALRTVGVVSLIAFPLTVIWKGEVLNPLSKDWLMHVRHVGRELSKDLPAGARLVVVNGTGFDPMPYAIRYDLWRPGNQDRDLRTVLQEGDTPSELRNMFIDGRATHLLLTGALIDMRDMTEPLGLPVVGNETVLFVWDGEGWQKLHAWPVVPAVVPDETPEEKPEPELSPPGTDQVADLKAASGRVSSSGGRTPFVDVRR